MRQQGNAQGQSEQGSGINAGIADVHDLTFAKK
jgi:hypothetical protein